MARGMVRSLDERIAVINAKIGNFQTKINELKEQRKELLDADRAAKLGKVLKVAEEKGMSVEDIIAKISD